MVRGERGSVVIFVAGAACATLAAVVTAGVSAAAVLRTEASAAADLAALAAVPPGDCALARAVAAANRAELVSCVVEGFGQSHVEVEASRTVLDRSLSVRARAHASR